MASNGKVPPTTQRPAQVPVKLPDTIIGACCWDRSTTEIASTQVSEQASRYDRLECTGSVYQVKVDVQAFRPKTDMSDASTFWILDRPAAGDALLDSGCALEGSAASPAAAPELASMLTPSPLALTTTC